MAGEATAPGWVNCVRCGTPQLIRSPLQRWTSGGASESNGAYFCNDGRECSLRIRRQRSHGAKP